MEIISLVVLIVLSLLGYSAGAAARAGKTTALNPQLIDLILMLLIWAGSIYTRLSLSLNRWLLILIWVMASFMVGFIIIGFRKLPKIKILAANEPVENSSRLKKNLWESWKEFSFIMGSFQSRILLSYFFFIFVTPIALAIKAFSDPLRIKSQSSISVNSHWLPKKEMNADQDQYRRQF
jgi:hypothetical protein